MNYKKIFLVGLLLSGSMYTVKASNAAMLFQTMQQGARTLAPVAVKASQKAFFPFMKTVGENFGKIGLTKEAMAPIIMTTVFQGINSGYITPKIAQVFGLTVDTTSGILSWKLAENLATKCFSQEKSKEQIQVETKLDKDLYLASLHPDSVHQELIDEAANQQRKPRAYLFSGKEGVGKSWLAEYYAKLSGRKLLWIRPGAISGQNAEDLNNIDQAIPFIMSNEKGTKITLVIDEGEEAFKKGTEKDSRNKALINGLTAQIAKLNESGYNVDVIACANIDKSQIDPSMVGQNGRFKEKIFSAKADLSKLRDILKLQFTRQINATLTEHNKVYKTQDVGQITNDKYTNLVDTLVAKTLPLMTETLATIPAEKQNINLRNIAEQIVPKIIDITADLNPGRAVNATEPKIELRPAFKPMPYLANGLGIAAAAAFLYCTNWHKEEDVTMGFLKPLAAYNIGKAVKTAIKVFENTRRVSLEKGTIDEKTKEFTSQGKAEIFNPDLLTPTVLDSLKPAIRTELTIQGQNPTVATSKHINSAKRKKQRTTRWGIRTLRP